MLQTIQTRLTGQQWIHSVNIWIQAKQAEPDAPGTYAPAGIRIDEGVLHFSGFASLR
jgi:hypothetical protein